MPQHSPVTNSQTVFNQHRNTLFPFSHRTHTDEPQNLLSTYCELFTAFNQSTMSNLGRHSPSKRGSSIKPRKSQWQKISERLHPNDTMLVHIMPNGVFLNLLRQPPPTLAKSLDMLLFSIAQRAP